MSDESIRKKLEQLCRLANSLDKEAKRRYGPEALLFFEADGGFYIMDGDAEHGAGQRQEHVKFSSGTYCTMGAGAW